MNIEKLKSLETDPNIVKKYIGISSFGKNRIVYLPMLIGIALLMFVLMAVFSDLTATIGMPILVALTVVSLICFVLVKVIANATKKKMIAETTVAPTSIAKKIAGNENEKVYFCIYITGEHRHYETLLDEIAEKIDIAIQNPQNATDKEVANLFRPDFANPNEFAKKLPLAFTDNIIVWRKQVSFMAVSKEINQKIEDEDGKFAMVAIVPENARFLFEYYT